ncbi:Tol-Pal system beta propeller repeat protein TolB [Thorsellia anophelis]|uniref:Tol-Pal system protein TolB n=1 Tax=Thorsellia anophelis DSM 18579 TaxID=1123402 RepID=A0A1H9ZVQ2_9GAMM|nr:Tol-Pal system beta propeller repeat protein TolB [Thorsellia anophelis]SES85458.1 TolB protein [Thorsellia anophelis DSM 18579]
MKKFYLISIMILMLFAKIVGAEIRIQISEDVDAARPIAILPFNSVGGGISGLDVSNIISADLRNSGKFSPLEAGQFPQNISNVAEIQPALWRSLGVDSIISGQIQPASDGRYTLTYQLIDISTGVPNVMMQNQAQIQTQWFRYGVHAVSDEVFEKLTGIKGAFRTKIAYVVKTNTSQYSHELRVSDYDGFNEITIHKASQPLMSPSWSPDGTKIAFVSFENGPSAVMLQDTQTGNVRKIASFPRHNGAPAFSPDGTKIAMALSQTGSLNLYVMDVGSGSLRQITNERSNSTEPAWFPDGQTLAFTSDKTGRPQIYRTSLGGGSGQRITFEGNQNQNARISPDGKFMVYITSSGGQQRLVKQTFANNALQFLTNSDLDESPSIAPNGTMVVYSTGGYASKLGLVSADGRFKTSLPSSGGQIKYPAWGPIVAK